MQKQLEKLEQIENLIVKYNDRLKDKSEILLNEYSLSTSKKIKDDLLAISDEARLMKIGIIGRVKAGKSSLINALIFDGKNILPAAATPMTAALTQIRYAQEYKVEIDFFSQEDIQNIKSKADEFQKLLDNELAKAKERPHNLGKSDEEILKPIKNRLIQDYEIAGASHQQYEMIKKSSFDISNTLEEKSFNDLEELKQALYDYVGESGKFMPFTKSVNIYLPIESLEGISIVDTPGINDPIISREARTKEELDQCDVVFIVSPSGNFITTEDIKLMDRISSKNGIREIYVVGSKCDTQICNSVKEEANGNFNKALEILKNKNTQHLSNVLSSLKESNPEVGDVFDTLIEKSNERIFLSSGLALSIINNKENLNSMEQHTFERLQKNYADNFSNLNDEITLASLNELSNINAIKKSLNAVALKKEEIKNQKINDYLNQKGKIIEDYLQSLILFIKERKEEIQSTKIEDLQSEKEEINNIKADASSVLDETYADIINEFETMIPVKLNTEFNILYNQATSDVNNAENTETRTESYQVSTSKWYNPFSWGSTKTEYETYTVTTVRTGAVKNALQNLLSNIENKIQQECFNNIKSLKDSIKSRLLKELRSVVDDDSINTRNFRQVISAIVSSLYMPQISFSDKKLPEGSGVLEGSSAQDFISSAQDFIHDLKTAVDVDIKTYTRNLTGELKRISLSQKLFQEYDKKLQELENDINNQALALSELSDIEKQLQDLKA
ncbi:dynamin family protein [Campylobacter sp. IFREMER_LSEM_CL1904]|uniref:dynamin family protein n=1 Tax=Campylobacter sp. IFREMER_LSEM_CL1904 TaxID=2911616 RepID=UPI0021E66C52|nr:dynamin family protein [Campylobacter sp. IFREMER_LSEM_CL1904]MCV3428306.1 dynamin family protein [Campylobacter sp. IFREMER_LSEM_CL1904]